jgi:L-gulono-1,4-lactone dehydrogenase
MWRNWSGDAVARPVRTLAPRDAGEVADAVAGAARDGLPVRMVGTGHSFTAAAVTDGVLLRPDRLTGIVGISGTDVTVRAGTRLRDLSVELARHGLALDNLGDIDVQTVAGAVSTGTHGTGAAYGGLAAQVTGLTLVAGDGSVVSPDPAAVAVGLGAFGVVTELTLRCVPAYALRAEETAERLDDLLARWDTLPAEAHHVEFYWWPHTRDAQLKRNTRVPLTDLDPLPRWRVLAEDELLTNAVFGAVCRAGARVPALVPPANRLATTLLGSRTYTDVSHRVFASPRRVRFRESEWAFPRACLPAVLAELDATIRRRDWRITFPVEVRVAAADDRWLSTAYGRDVAYLAAHRYVREPHEDYLTAVADIVHAVAGPAARPHWGKLHPLTAADLAPRYPRFADALALRAELDPEGRFRNPYTQRVLGRL